MPQLDIVYILTIHLWTWLVITMITLKIKTLALINKPKEQSFSNLQPTTPPLPWT